MFLRALAMGEAAPPSAAAAAADEKEPLASNKSRSLCDDVGRAAGHWSAWV